MHPVTLVLIVHDHQPVGNFDHVFERSHRDAYAPFLAFLERHPRVRLALHTSGPLLEWLDAHERDYLKRLSALGDAGQVELWGGGFFEPVLAAIPEHDRLGQISMMAEWLDRKLGERPAGLWLTERVWEPGLASSLARAEVEYTAVDDAHFIAAGLARDQLWGYYLTEDQGQKLAVFPIHRELRYAVPFQPPKAAIDVLRRVAEGGEGRIAVLGDDGEKFGVWPGTHKVCWEEGWLDRFAALLEENPWIEMRLPAAAIAHHAPRGLVYLPTASYHELQEWALPPEAQERYHRAAERLEGEFGEEAHDLLRGGHWRGFLARYPEANRMHKRAARASRLLHAPAARKRRGWEAARERLWRAQCNDVYWHGVFGGLYLPHLRAAAYRELIAAEAFVGGQGTRVEYSDLDLDGDEDALLETPAWAAWVTARGGALWALDDRVRGWTIGDTLARRPEYYHARLRDAALGGGEGETIHAAIRLKEPGLAELIEHYDTRGRASFLDRWSEAGIQHEWGVERFGFEHAAGSGLRLELAEGAAPAIEKRYVRADHDTLEVTYTLTSGRPRQGALEVELNLGFHVPRAADRFVELDGQPDDPPHLGAQSARDGVRTTSFVDAWADRRLTIAIDPPCDFRRAPIETVSLSEGGAERVFQGVEARYRVALGLEPGRPARVRFRLTLSAAHRASELTAGEARA
jgi:alpha-amylase